MHIHVRRIIHQFAKGTDRADDGCRDDFLQQVLQSQSGEGVGVDDCYFRSHSRFFVSAKIRDVYKRQVMNSAARSFYREHGLSSIAPAYEAQAVPDAVLMFCKHCLRFSMEMCIRDRCTSGCTSLFHFTQEGQVPQAAVSVRLGQQM